MIWFTSDLHFNHSKIIEYCDRPFKNAWEMDRALINNWNAKVAADDVVYVLGDVSFGSPGYTAELLYKLKGRKHLVAGNHDSKKVRRMDVWESSQDYLEASLNGVLFVMLHFPIHSWNKKSRGAVHVHAHTHGGSHHGKMEPMDNRFDVGVDAWEYSPVSIETLLELRKEKGR